MKKRIATFLLCLALCFTIGGELMLSLFTVPARAQEVTYSNVLDDLKKDPSFDPSDYPDKPDDYSLKVIQIAEGKNGELFLYVYQPIFPYRNDKASYINIAFQDQRDPTADLKYERRSLTFLNSNGALCKYLINDCYVSDDTIRYYSVASIYRPYIEGVDMSYEAIDSKQHSAFAVGKLWSACVYNNELSYGCFDIDTVDVEITASGDVYYKDGLQGLYLSACNSHYFAFKVENYSITDIFDADITYDLIPYSHTVLSDPKIDDSRETISKDSETIYKSQEVTFEPTGLFGKKATWKRIQTVTEFLTDVKAQNKEFESCELEDINAAQFVFRVAETDYFTTLDYVDGNHLYRYYRLANSGVLRLHFATADGVYNLGAVSDLVGTDGMSDTKDDPSADLKEWWEELLSILGLILFCLAISAFWGPISFVLNVLWVLLKLVLKIILKILSLPFKFIGWLFKPK